MKARPTPPHPDLARRPSGAFGWLDARLLHEEWCARIGPAGTCVLVLLALAADGQGASFYGRERMSRALGLPREEVDRGLARLLDLGLVAHRPWRPGFADGVWQLLPLPPRDGRQATSEPPPVAFLLARLGVGAPHR